MNFILEVVVTDRFHCKNLMEADKEFAYKTGNWTEMFTTQWSVIIVITKLLYVYDLTVLH